MHLEIKENADDVRRGLGLSPSGRRVSSEITQRLARWANIGRSVEIEDVGGDWGVFDRAKNGHGFLGAQSTGINIIVHVGSIICLCVSALGKSSSDAGKDLTKLGGKYLTYGILPDCMQLEPGRYCSRRGYEYFEVLLSKVEYSHLFWCNLLYLMKGGSI